MSIAFWVLMLLILGVVDTFYTPNLMNHTHGAVRWLGFVLSTAPALPVIVLAFRIYEKIRSYLFTKSLWP